MRLLYGRRGVCLRLDEQAHETCYREQWKLTCDGIDDEQNVMTIISSHCLWQRLGHTR